MHCSWRSERAPPRSARSIRISTCLWSAVRRAGAICTSRASPIDCFCAPARSHYAYGRTAMTDKNFTLDVDGDGIALVTWNMPGRSMNVIDMDVMDELSGIIEK